MKKRIPITVLSVHAKGQPQDLRGERVRSEASSEIDPAVARLALDAVCELLRLRLGPWIGDDACDRLLHRTLVLSAANRPTLFDAAMLSAPASRDAVGQAGGIDALPPDGARVVEAFLGTLFDLLGRLVGDDMAARLIVPPLPDLPARAGPRAPGDAR